jgi:pectate lyase
VAGQTIAPAVLVQVQDENAASVSSNGVPITLTLTSGSGALSGTLTQNTDSNGKATFNDLSIDTAGTGKQLTASASGIGTGLTNALSATFTISPVPPPPPPIGPVITQTLVSPGSVVLRGTNGTHNGNYEVLSSTDLLLSSNLWTSLGSNVFDATGHFDSTNSISTTDVQRYFRLLDEGVPASTNLPDFSQVGFANAGFNVNGGEGGPTVYVGSESELQTYSDANSLPYIIYITNSFNLSGLSTHIRPNKTVIGLGNVVLSGGGLYLYRSTNVIIRNLTIRNSTEDNIGIHYSSRIWIDHCTLIDATDGQLDLTQESDYTTISWCKLYYTANPPAGDHRFVSLIAANDADNGSQYHVTYHHNWWGENCIERMPSVRFGRVHVYNCYYNCPGDNYCVRTRIEAECRVENNFFQSVQNPWERYITGSGDIQGKLYATNNNVGFLETSFGVTWTGTKTNKDATIRQMIPGTDTVFTPPYSYTLDTASSVPNIVTNYAGAGKGPFAP